MIDHDYSIGIHHNQTDKLKRREDARRHKGRAKARDARRDLAEEQRGQRRRADGFE